MRKLKVTEMNRLTVEQFHEAEKQPLAVVLDNVRSAYNVGSVLRTADAFRIAKVYLCGITACPPSIEIHKTALGAEDSVEWEHCDSAEEAVIRLRQEGYTVYAAEQAEGSTMLQDFGDGKEERCEFMHEEKRAVVLGNEVKGVQQSVIDICDGCIEIPQAGTKHSLNIAVAAGIVLWHLSLPWINKYNIGE